MYIVFDRIDRVTFSSPAAFFSNLKSWHYLIKMDGKRHKLARLPELVLHGLCQYLDPNDVKNLSLTSHELMSAIENVQKWAPRLHLITTDPTSQHKRLTRMIPEAYPGSYLINRRNSIDHKQHEIISLTCLPASPPTYNEAQSASWSSALRFHTSTESDEWKQIVWLCPHVGCKLEDIQHLTRQQESPISVYDTTAILCPFPKCSLWARHGVVVTRTIPATYEMCSTIRVYRRQCSSFDVIRRFLLGRVVSPHLVRAIQQLRLPICSHLNIGSPQVLACLTFHEESLLQASQHCIDIGSVPRFQQALYQQCCQECRVAGTYTTWGFLARYTKDSDAFWLDVEMVLCRPLFDSDAQDDHTSMHWRHHSSSRRRMAFHKIAWESWASVVAAAGFDWRRPLPAAFLKQPSRGLLDFPSRTINFYPATSVPRPIKNGQYTLRKVRPPVSKKST